MTSIFQKTLVAVAALAVSVPAFAAPSAATQKTVLKYDAKTQEYCLSESATTGSRIGRKICKSAAQWSAAGLDMPKTVVLAQN